MSVSLAALAAIGSLAATGIGAVSSASANAEARARLASDQAEARRYYERLLNRDYVNSSENQSLLRKLREIQRKNYEQARATNVVAGGTDASLAAMQQSGNKVVTDVAGGIASRSDAYKERVGAAKRASERAYSQQMFGLDAQKAQTIANAAGQATKAMAGIAAAAGSEDNPFGGGLGDSSSSNVLAQYNDSVEAARNQDYLLEHYVSGLDKSWLDPSIANIFGRLYDESTVK
jgi:hypothetical protein